jgi:hypothetical protein
MSFFPNSERKTIKRFGFAAFFLLFGLLAQAEAQSGRRTRKPLPTVQPPALPSATIEAPNSDSARQPARGLPAKVRLVIGRQPTSKHLQSEDLIAASFVKRLNAYANVEGTSIGDIEPGQASTRAKAETEALVVVLKFEVDSYQNGTIILNSHDLEIEYVVFAPRTGKKLTKGKVYFQAIGGGRMRKRDWPNGTPIKITPESAGIEAAESLYYWLLFSETKKESQ